MQYKADLADDEWTWIHQVRAIGTETFFYDESPERISLAKGFYRIVNEGP